jgi:hypothetical protein
MKFKDLGVDRIDLKVEWSDDNEGWIVESPQVDNITAVEDTIPKALTLFAEFFEITDEEYGSIKIINDPKIVDLHNYLKALVKFNDFYIDPEVDKVDKFSIESICNEDCFFNKDGYCELFKKNLNLSPYLRKPERCSECFTEFKFK